MQLEYMRIQNTVKIDEYMIVAKHDRPCIRQLVSECSSIFGRHLGGRLRLKNSHVLMMTVL